MDHFHTFEHIESSINSQLMKLKSEKKSFPEADKLKPAITLKNSNTNVNLNEKSKLDLPKCDLVPISPTNLLMSNDYNIYYDHRLTSFDNPFLATTNPSTVYRLQKILNIPKGRDDKNLNTKQFNFKLNELNIEKQSTTTKYRLSKANAPNKPETFYKPASSYTEKVNPNKIVRSLTNSTSSADNDDNNDVEIEESDFDQRKIVEIEKIRNKLKDEYNNLLMGSNLVTRPKSATICTPNIQYLKSAIDRHNDLDFNHHDELRIVPLNKTNSLSNNNLASRPNSASTSRSKNINNNNKIKFRSQKPQYIDCESDDLALELDKSMCQFKYESNSSNLMINSTQILVPKSRDSKQSFYSNNDSMDARNNQHKVYVTTPIKQAGISNNNNNNMKLPLESLVNYATNKHPNPICINGKSMASTSGVDFSNNYDHNVIVFYLLY